MQQKSVNNFNDFASTENSRRSQATGLFDSIILEHDAERADAVSVRRRLKGQRPVARNVGHALEEERIGDRNRVNGKCDMLARERQRCAGGKLLDIRREKRLAGAQALVAIRCGAYLKAAAGVRAVGADVARTCQPFDAVVGAHHSPVCACACGIKENARRDDVCAGQKQMHTIRKRTKDAISDS
jgi:hypothetical protein